MTDALRSYDEALLRRAFDVRQTRRLTNEALASAPACAEARLAIAVFIHDVGMPRRVSIFRGCLPSDFSPSVTMRNASSADPKRVTFLRCTLRRAVMDKNRVAGSIKEIKGAAKEAVGKAVGDAKLQSDGRTDKAVGKIQNAVGGLNDAVRDAVKKP
jgi:uncharacterized protein YjbJ (UPF0337 family)